MDILRLSNQNRRNKDIDLLKTLAIFLVVISHIIQQKYIEGFNDNYAIRYICAFNMPLFMFLSGVVQGIYNSSKIEVNWFWKRTKQLILPYFAWSII